jgi:DNA primase
MRNDLRLDIQRIWQAVFGEDVTRGKRSAPEQYRVLCPWHHENHPSCDVSLAKNTFFCRSCPARGGALQVVVLAGYARDNGEAVEWLKAHGVAC